MDWYDTQLLLIKQQAKEQARVAMNEINAGFCAAEMRLGLWAHLSQRFNYNGKEMVLSIQLKGTSPMTISLAGQSVTIQ